MEGVINYPISIGYRKNWGDWEAVREIIQNAIDTGTKVKVTNKDGKLIVRDSGHGFELKNLIIGESSKNGIDSIGKFGEGMKFSILSLLRDNRKITIYTNNIIINTRLSETFGVKTLCIDYKDTKVFLKGTKVIIEGVESDFKDKFLGYNLRNNLKERVLFDRPGDLFVKGIFVKKIKSLVGYNLNMERENPITGDVDIYDVQSKIADMIYSNYDRRYARSVLETITDDKYLENIERDCYVYNNPKHPNIWRDEIKSVIGEKVCVQTDLDVSRVAAYNGFKIINPNSQAARILFKNDVDAIKEKCKDDVRIAKKNLSNVGINNISKMKKFINDYLDVQVDDLRIVKFSDEKTIGSAKFSKYIKISDKVVDNFENFLSLMLHELVHYIYGYSDLSEEFQSALCDISSKMMMNMQKMNETS